MTRYQTIPLINKLRTVKKVQTIGSGYYDPATSTGGAGSTTGRREFLITEKQSRARQKGTVIGAKVKTSTNILDSNLTSISIGVHRQKPTGRFDRVGESENILSQLQAAGVDAVATVLFKKKFTVKEGDYPSAVIESNSTLPNILANIVGTNTSGVSMRILNNTDTEFDIDWTVGSTTANVIRVQLIYEEAPVIMCIGDSLIAGHNAHHSFLEVDDTKDAVEKSLPYKLSQMLDVPVQNMGIGAPSNKSADGDARFNADIVAYGPSACIINYGTSDIANSVLQATYIANITSMITKCINNNILPIVININPRDDFSDANHATRRTWNGLVRPLVEDQGGIFVDTTEYVGLLRASTGFKDDKIAEFSDPDQTHFVEKGIEAVADAIIDAISNSKISQTIDVPIHPVLRTAEKQAIEASEGMEVYDSTLSKKQIFLSGSWTDI
ncbi:MAG: hypothetical protein KC444_09195 [Nitrosopumilus sp.]|nr:hypothetical protein [Nitrosopumilus sp.]